MNYWSKKQTIIFTRHIQGLQTPHHRRRRPRHRRQSSGHDLRPQIAIANAAGNVALAFMWGSRGSQIIDDEGATPLLGLKFETTW